MTQPPTFTLGATPETTAPDALLAFLKAHSSSDVEVDVSQTKTLSAHHLEIVLSAYKEWSKDGHAVALTKTTETHRQQLSGLGLPAPLFPEGT